MFKSQNTAKEENHRGHRPGLSDCKKSLPHTEPHMKEPTNRQGNKHDKTNLKHMSKSREWQRYEDFRNWWTRTTIETTGPGQATHQSRLLLLNLKRGKNTATVIYNLVCARMQCAKMVYARK